MHSAAWPVDVQWHSARPSVHTSESLRVPAQRASDHGGHIELQLASDKPRVARHWHAGGVPVCAWPAKCPFRNGRPAGASGVRSVPQCAAPLTGTGTGTGNAPGPLQVGVTVGPSAPAPAAAGPSLQRKKLKTPRKRIRSPPAAGFQVSCQCFPDFHLHWHWQGPCACDLRLINCSST